MVSGVSEARSIAARAAIAPRSMAETVARAPPGRPSPRLPPIHSAMGVRAPETMTTSVSPLSDKRLLLVIQRFRELVEGPGGRGPRERSGLLMRREGER